LFTETEGFLTAIQDQVILKRNYKKHILMQPDNMSYAACEQLAATEYVKRHGGLVKIIHQKLAEAAELIDDKSPCYKYTPANVLGKENFKLYWNRSILTDKTVPFN